MDRINGAGTVDIGGGRRGFIDEDLGVGQEGTEVTALWLNMTQEEMIKVIEEAGLVLNPADWTQLWQALQILGLSKGAKGRRWTAVLSMTLSSAPGAPAAGDTYLVPTGATGVWSTQVGKLAEWNGSAWTYTTPSDGHGIGLPDGKVFVRIGGSYVPFAPAATNTVAGVVSLDALRTAAGAAALTAVTVARSENPTMVVPNDTITVSPITSFEDDAQADWVRLGNQLICQRAGRYMVFGSLGGGCVNPLSAFSLGVRLNGAEFFSASTRFSSAIINQLFGGAAEVRSFVAGDVLEMWLFQSSGGAQTIQTASRLALYRLTGL